MTALEEFISHFTVFSQAEAEDMESVFIQHGVVHLFMEQFDLGCRVFQECLCRDGHGTAAMGSPREIIMAAYEAYLFVDEDSWLDMLRDRYETGMLEGYERVQRIVKRYIPAFRNMIAMLR